MCYNSANVPEAKSIHFLLYFPLLQKDWEYLKIELDLSGTLMVKFWVQVDSSNLDVAAWVGGRRWKETDFGFYWW